MKTPLSSNSTMKELELIGKMAEVIGKKIDMEPDKAAEVITEFMNIIIANEGYYEDEKWPYYDYRDNDAPGKCSMLQLNFHIERHPGIVLYIDLRRKYNL